jgi:hypothetical protein
LVLQAVQSWVFGQTSQLLKVVYNKALMLEYVINFKLAECSKSLKKMNQAQFLSPTRLAAEIERIYLSIPTGD